MSHAVRAQHRVLSARGVGAVLLWGVLQGVFLLVPPLAAIPLNLAVAGAFLWWFVMRRAAVADLRQRATLRLRDMGAAARWVPVLALPLVVHVLAYLLVVPRFLPVPAPDVGLLEAYLKRPFGGLAVVSLAAVIAPLLE